MTVGLPSLPAQESFSESGQKFLDAIYSAHHAFNTVEKISALKTFLKKEVMVTSYSGDDSEQSDLLALEYFVLIESGFDE
jgi:hypothetical protein